MKQRQIISLIFGVMAVLGAAYFLLEAGFEFYDYFVITQELVRKSLLHGAIFLILAGALLFQAYRFVKYFAKKPSSP